MKIPRRSHSILFLKDKTESGEYFVEQGSTNGNLFINTPNAGQTEFLLGAAIQNVDAFVGGYSYSIQDPLPSRGLERIRLEPLDTYSFAVPKNFRLVGNGVFLQGVNNTNSRQTTFTQWGYRTNTTRP